MLVGDDIVERPRVQFFVEKREVTPMVEGRIVIVR